VSHRSPSSLQEVHESLPDSTARPISTVGYRLAEPPPHSLAGTDFVTRTPLSWTTGTCSEISVGGVRSRRFRASWSPTRRGSLLYDGRMIRTTGLVAVIGFLCGGCCIAAAESALPFIPIDAPVNQVQSAAERIVASFATRVIDLLDRGVPPSVEVRNTPNLAYFDHRSWTIVTAHWPTLGSPSREFFLKLTETAEDAAALFVGLFNEFLVAHEMAHWLYRTLGIELDRYTSEREANDLAAAFFVASPDGQTRLLALRPRLEAALARLADPTPPRYRRAGLLQRSIRRVGEEPVLVWVLSVPLHPRFDRPPRRARFRLSSVRSRREAASVRPLRSGRPSLSVASGPAPAIRHVAACDGRSRSASPAPRSTDAELHSPSSGRYSSVSRWKAYRGSQTSGSLMSSSAVSSLTIRMIPASSRVMRSGMPPTSSWIASSSIRRSSRCVAQTGPAGRESEGAYRKSPTRILGSAPHRWYVS
jgi:hypothetical protein